MKRLCDILLLEYQKAWKPLLAGHKLVFLLMKSSLSSVQWEELVVDLTLCLLEWTLDCLHLEEDLWEAFGKTMFEDLLLRGAHQESVRAASCENTCWVLAWHTLGEQQELTCALSVPNRSSSCGGPLTPGWSTSISSPCSPPSACGTWAESLPPCCWKGGWSLSQTSSGTLLHFLKESAGKEGRLGRLQLQSSLLCSFSSLPFSNLVTTWIGLFFPGMGNLGHEP